MTEAEVLIAGITKQYNKTEDEAKAIVYEYDEAGAVKGIHPEALNRIYSLDEQRVASWKTRQSDTVTKAVNEAVGKTHGFYETKLKTQFAIDSDLKGEELLTEVENRMKVLASGDGKGKNSKEYLELEGKQAQLIKQLADFDTKIKTDYVPKSEVERASRLSEGDRYASQVVSSLNLLYDEDKTIQQNKMKYFNIELKSRFDDVRPSEDGKKYYVFKDGQRVENASGHAVEYSEIIKEVALGFWPVIKQNTTGNGNNNPNTGGGGSAPEYTAWQKIIDNPASTPAEKYKAQVEIQKARAGIK